MHRLQRAALCLGATLLLLGSTTHAADDIITWIRKCGGLVRPSVLFLRDIACSFLGRWMVMQQSRQGYISRWMKRECANAALICER